MPPSCHCVTSFPQKGAGNYDSDYAPTSPCPHWGKGAVLVRGGKGAFFDTSTLVSGQFIL